MKYITFEKLALKLEGRLKIVEIEENPIYPNQSLFQEVRPDIVELVVEEQESFIDLILGQIYVMPLQNQHPILANITADLVIAELLMVHFQGSGLANIGHDLSNLGRTTKADAMEKLKMLTIGYNIYLPSSQVMFKTPGLSEYRRIVLEGESLVSTKPNQITVNNETVVINMEDTFNNGVNPFGDKFGEKWHTKDIPYYGDYD